MGLSPYLKLFLLPNARFCRVAAKKRYPQRCNESQVVYQFFFLIKRLSIFAMQTNKK